MAPHSSTLAWKIPWMEEPGGLHSMGLLQFGGLRLSNHFHFSLSCNGDENGNPLQCSCLENPRDGRAWWATIYGVAQSQTQLKRLSSSSSRHWSKHTPVSSSFFYFSILFINFSVNPYFFPNVVMIIVYLGSKIYEGKQWTAS